MNPYINLNFQEATNTTSIPLTNFALLNILEKEYKAKIDISRILEKLDNAVSRKRVLKNLFDICNN